MCNLVEVEQLSSKYQSFLNFLFLLLFYFIILFSSQRENGGDMQQRVVQAGSRTRDRSKD